MESYKSKSMDKRTFIKNSAIIGIGGLITPVLPGYVRAAGTAAPGNSGDTYRLPELDYPYDALEPYIDAMTMEIHYSKHHAGYTMKFNAAVEESGLQKTPVKEIFRKASSYPVAVRNNGGGFYNHKMFWKVLSPDGGGEPKGGLARAIDKGFGSFDKFREEFSGAAATRFGSGWAWLVGTEEGLRVTSTPNQDNPLMDTAEVRGFPLMGLDVWEHAYYLKYQNRRGDYISAFWNLVNWDYVASRFEKSMK